MAKEEKKVEEVVKPVEPKKTAPAVPEGAKNTTMPDGTVRTDY